MVNENINQKFSTENKPEAPTEQSRKYVNGEKYTYNRFEDTFGDAGRYSDETPRKRNFLNKTHWKLFIGVAVVIGLASLALVVLFSLGCIS